jgi:hypothetical protein
MTERSRIVTSAFALAAIAAIGALLVLGAGGSGAGADVRPERPCGAATDATYLSTAFAVAVRIRDGERSGSAVRRDVRTIEADRVLANAVAAGDIATVHSEVLALVFNHTHIVRLRVLRNGQVLDDVGGPRVLAPVTGSLRAGGRTVGTFVMSIQDDLGYQKLVDRLIGARVVMRYHGQTVMSDIAVGSQPLAPGGTVAVGGVRYLVASLEIGRFPSGTLRVSILLPRPRVALRRSSCAQVRADLLADIAERAYDEAETGDAFVGPPLNALAHTTTLSAALAAGDDAGAAQIVKSMVAAGDFARLRVVAGGRVIADAGVSIPLLAPLTRPLLDAAGQRVGQAIFAVQSAHGYANLTHALGRVPVLVRAGSQQLAGTFAGPATLPSSGPLTYLGVSYEVASFVGTRFPRGAVRIYVLSPG